MVGSEPVGSQTHNVPIFESDVLATLPPSYNVHTSWRINKVQHTCFMYMLSSQTLLASVIAVEGGHVQVFNMTILHCNGRG